MLEFLSNYYIYFLIAAGVLFFALIGLLVDMKKKRENPGQEQEAPAAETPTENGIPEPPVAEEQPLPAGDIPTPPAPEAVPENLNPAPPMPVEEPISNVNPAVENSAVINNEVSVNNQVLDSTPVMDIGVSGGETTQQEIK